RHHPSIAAGKRGLEVGASQELHVVVDVACVKHDVLLESVIGIVPNPRPQRVEYEWAYSGHQQQNDWDTQASSAQAQQQFSTLSPQQMPDERKWEQPRVMFGVQRQAVQQGCEQCPVPAACLQ